VNENNTEVIFGDAVSRGNKTDYQVHGTLVQLYPLQYPLQNT